MTLGQLFYKHCLLYIVCCVGECHEVQTCKSSYMRVFGWHNRIKRICNDHVMRSSNLRDKHEPDKPSINRKNAKKHC